MPDPITLTVIGTVALTEGIKFLYGQAGEILKRWRERKKDAEAKTSAKPAPVENANVKLPAVFEGQLVSPMIHFDNFAELEGPLLQWRKELANYVDETMPIESSDQNLVQATDELRRILEAVYRQRITFKGEKREPSGTVINADVELGNILGRATMVKIDQIQGGEVNLRAKAGDVGADGEFIGVDIKDAS